MSPKKTAAKKAPRRRATGENVSGTDPQIAPVDDYEERPYEPRSAEDTALAERRFTATVDDDAPQIEVPDITAADVERILADRAEADVDTDVLEARTREIEELNAPPEVILDNPAEDE